jgi:hypothetical protein
MGGPLSASGAFGPLLNSNARSLLREGRLPFALLTLRACKRMAIMGPRAAKLGEFDVRRTRPQLVQGSVNWEFTVALIEQPRARAAIWRTHSVDFDGNGASSIGGDIGLLKHLSFGITERYLRVVLGDRSLDGFAAIEIPAFAN